MNIFAKECIEMNGGFINIDFGGNDVSDIDTTGVTIKGIYSKLKDAVRYGKAVVLNNIVIDDADVSPVYAIASDGESLSFGIGDTSFEVTSSDVVKAIET